VWSIRMPVFLCLFVLSCLICNSGQAALAINQDNSYTVVCSDQLRVIDIRSVFKQANIPQMVEKYSTLSTDYTKERQEIFNQFIKEPGFQKSLDCIRDLIQERKKFNADLLEFIDDSKDWDEAFERCLQITGPREWVREKALDKHSSQEKKIEVCVGIKRLIGQDLNSYKLLETLIDSLGENLKNSKPVNACQVFTVFQLQIACVAKEEFFAYHDISKKCIKQDQEGLHFSEWPMIWRLHKLLGLYQWPEMTMIAPQLLEEDFRRRGNTDLVGDQWDWDSYKELQTLIRNHWQTLPQEKKMQYFSDITRLAQYNYYFDKAEAVRQLESQYNNIFGDPSEVFLHGAWNGWMAGDTVMNISFLLGNLVNKPEFNGLVFQKVNGKQKAEKLQLRKQGNKLINFNTAMRNATDKIKAGLLNLSSQLQTSETPQVLATASALEATSSALIEKANESKAPVVAPQENPKPDLDPVVASLGLSENNNNPQKLEVVSEEVQEVKLKISADMIKLLEGWKWIFKQSGMVENIFSFKAKIDFQELCGFLVKCGGSIETDKGGSHGKVMIPKSQSVRYNPGAHNLSANAFASVSFPIVRGHLGDEKGKASQLSKLFARQFLSTIGMTPKDIERLQNFVRQNKL
jgi:hypothetical protein